MLVRSTLISLVLLAFARPAVADPEPARDGAIIGGAATVALLFNYLPIHKERPLRDRELVRFDERVRDNYSPGASIASDISLGLAVAVPAALAIGTTGDEAARDRALVLGESLALTLAATSVTKVLVARPRPYAYSDDPRAIHKVDTAGRDAYRSFFSGHAATAFAAAAGSGILYASHETGRTERALVFGTGALLAGSAANLRVRAGKHFYSDVVVGALVGTAFGTVVPALHAGELYAPSGTEWLAIGGGLVLGIVSSELLPVGSSTSKLALSPLVVRDGGGIAFGGAL